MLKMNAGLGPKKASQANAIFRQLPLDCAPQRTLDARPGSGTPTTFVHSDIFISLYFKLLVLVV